MKEQAKDSKKVETVQDSDEPSEFDKLLHADGSVWVSPQESDEYEFDIDEEYDESGEDYVFDEEPTPEQIDLEDWAKGHAQMIIEESLEGVLESFNSGDLPQPEVTKKICKICGGQDPNCPLKRRR